MLPVCVGREGGGRERKKQSSVKKILGELRLETRKERKIAANFQIQRQRCETDAETLFITKLEQGKEHFHRRSNDGRPVFGIHN